MERRRHGRERADLGTAPRSARLALDPSGVGGLRGVRADVTLSLSHIEGPCSIFHASHL